MKNEVSSNISAWFDVSSNENFSNYSDHLCLFALSCLDNLDDERSWIRKYLELDRTQRTLTFYSNDVCNRFVSSLDVSEESN